MVRHGSSSPFFGLIMAQPGVCKSMRLISIRDSSRRDFGGGPKLALTRFRLTPVGRLSTATLQEYETGIHNTRRVAVNLLHDGIG
jgi:hypothetical protein